MSPPARPPKEKKPFAPYVPTHRDFVPCPTCGGLVLLGRREQGEAPWITPVLGEPHDCATWRELLAKQ